MGIKSFLYDVLKYSNDISATSKAAKQRSAKPIVRRIGRRAYGKLTGSLARKLFG